MFVYRNSIIFNEEISGYIVRWKHQRLRGTAGSTKAKLVAEADTNVVLTRQNCLVNTVGNSSVTIYNKMVGATVAVAVSIE